MYVVHRKSTVFRSRGQGHQASYNPSQCHKITDKQIGMVFGKAARLCTLRPH